MSQKITMLYVTCADAAEARSIARALVEERLAACANIIQGMESIYRWKGEITSSGEVVLIVKTTHSLAQACAGRIRERHSYEIPCVLPFDIDGVNNPFADWVSGEVG